MIKLIRLNVVKEVTSEYKAEKLEKMGFKRVEEAVDDEAVNTKERKNTKKAKEEKNKAEWSEDNGAGTGGADCGGDNGQSQTA